MSSADFSKQKSSQDAKAKIMHDDKEERLKNKHTNPDIDKSKTANNLSYFGRSYKDVCSLYDSIIAKCDAGPKPNMRSDRVTVVCLEIPTPEGLKPKDEEKFFRRAGEELCEFYGEENLLEGYFHVDEQHEYLDKETHAAVMSRNHATFRFIPRVDDSLNAREFSRRKNIVRVNMILEEMCHKEFNVEFHTGKGKKRGRTVEELKNESIAEVKILYNKTKKKEILLNAREASVDIRQDAREASLNDQQGSLDVERAFYRQTLEEESRRALNADRSVLTADLQDKYDAYKTKWTAEHEEAYQEHCKTYDQRMAQAEKLNSSNKPNRRMPNTDFSL